MSVAGLRYGADAAAGARGPLETRSGAPIFHGDPASYHDWEFRVLLRLELLETQEQALRRAAQAEMDEEVENGPGQAVGVEEDEDLEGFPSTEPSRTLSTPSKTKRKSYDPEKDIAKERTLLVSKIMEGLRGDAFLVAQDLGVAALIADNGIRTLIHKLKESVFPRASEEARELRGGMLARQVSESMVSYVDRRRRWWRMISEMDGTTQLSEPMRCELMIELSGITQQEALVVKEIAEHSWQDPHRTLRIRALEGRQITDLGPRDPVHSPRESPKERARVSRHGSLVTLWMPMNRMTGVMGLVLMVMIPTMRAMPQK